MRKRVFVKFVSEPKNDPLKAIIGVACAAQAIDDEHEVSVFFAGCGTRLLDDEYIGELNREMGPDSTMVSDLLNKIFDHAIIYCSFASVKATLGHSEGDGALNIADDKIVWSGPPGVIKLATNSDVQLTY
jgi:predicted peroxiredoxin